MIKNTDGFVVAVPELESRTATQRGRDRLRPDPRWLDQGAGRQGILMRAPPRARQSEGQCRGAGQHRQAINTVMNVMPQGFADFREDYQRGVGRLLSRRRGPRRLGGYVTDAQHLLGKRRGRRVAAAPCAWSPTWSGAAAAERRRSIAMPAPPYAFVPGRRSTRACADRRKTGLSSRGSVRRCDQLCSGCDSPGIEQLPDENPDDIGVPEALLGRPSLFAIFDDVTDLPDPRRPVIRAPRLMPHGAGRRRTPARGRARQRMRRTSGWRPNCSPTRRSARSI